MRWGTWCCYVVWTDISIYMCMHIHNSPFCVCVCTWIWCVCVCVWFLCNIPNLSNFGPRWEALLFSWRSRRATKTVVHFGNRLKLWTSNAAHSNNLSWLSFKWLWTWTWAVNVRVDMDVGAKPLTMPTTGQFKRRPQGSKNNLSVIARFAYMSWQQQRLFNV